MKFNTLKYNIFNKLQRSPVGQNVSAESATTSMDDASLGDTPFVDIGAASSVPTPAPSQAVALASAVMACKLGRAALEIPGPVKTVARISVKSGAAGAMVDGIAAGICAAQAVERGDVSMKQATIHVASESACGFLTGTAGTAGTMAAFMLTGSLGPIVLASGAASSMIARWGYRRIVGETLPTENAKNVDSKVVDNIDGTDGDEPFEDIGPED